MRKSLQFDLDTGSAKPVIVSSMNADLTFLIDTGADTPVWCRGEEELLDLFPETSRLEYRYLLSGFGTGVEVVDAFCIPEFCLSDGVETITYSNFVVAAADRPSIGCDLILPASIFNHAILSIDRLTSVVSPTMLIEYEKDRIPVFFRRVSLTPEQQKILKVSNAEIVAGVYFED